MSFESVLKNCQDWLKQNPNQNIKLIESVPKERKFSFKYLDLEFFVIYPAEEADKWVVWSESDQTLSRIANVQDFLDSEKTRTIYEILDITLKSIEKSEEDEDNNDDDDDYYLEDDMDAIDTELYATDDTDDGNACAFFGGTGNKAAVSRLVKDMKVLEAGNGKYGVNGAPKGDNLFLWDVYLENFEEGTQLCKDIRAYAERYERKPAIHMQMHFPPTYPMSPPFVRIIRPRFKFLCGHVTIGGSICMQALTRSGWSPTNDIEGLLVQIRAEIVSDPNASLDPRNMDVAYDEADAKSAFDRMVLKYEWS